MNPYVLGTIAGAILATFLVSRLFLWLSRKWLTGNTAILAAHGVTLLVIFVAAGFGRSDGEGFQPDGVLIYLLPLAGWLVFDLVWSRRKARSVASGDAEAG